ncbi:acetylglutamate kinase [soil metagenome]
MMDLAKSADILLRATARARAFHGKTFVIKLGGSAMEDPAATAGTLDAIAALHHLNLRLTLVHGGGKPIDRAMAAAGIEVKKVQGRRYTDEATMAVVLRVLNEITHDLCEQLKARGIRSSWEIPIKAERLLLPGNDLQPVDLGLVGQPVDIDFFKLQFLCENNYLPVIASLGRQDGGYLNINADTAASAIAGAMKAEACLFLTDTPGVLKDRHDPASLLPRLTVAECKQLIADGVIDGGMIPKVEACFEALDAGAGKAVILDGRNPHSLLSLVLSDTLTGTEITQ